MKMIRKVLFLFFITITILILQGCTTESVVLIQNDEGKMVEVARIKQDAQGVAEFIKKVTITTDKNGKVVKVTETTFRVDTDEDGNFFTRNVGSIVRDAAKTAGAASPF